LNKGCGRGLYQENQKMSFLEALPDIAFELVAKLCFAFIYIIISKTQVATSSKPLIIKASRNAKNLVKSRLPEM
jgi:hypothetical protein